MIFLFLHVHYFIGARKRKLEEVHTNYFVNATELNQAKKAVLLLQKQKLEEEAKHFDIDAKIKALQKEKLELEIIQLKNELTA